MNRVLFFCHKTDCIAMVLGILNLEGHQNCMNGSKITAFCMYLIFSDVFLLPFQKVKSQINQLQNESLGKSNENTLFSEFAILP